MLQPTCRVCRSVAVRFLCSTPNEHSRTPQLDHYRCNSCGSVFVGNPFSQEELAEAYGTQDQTSYYAETRAASMPKFASAASDILRLCGTSAVVIDIGGGDGELLRALHGLGVRDLSLHEIPGPPSNGLATILKREFRDFDCSSVPTATFDVVAMMDVLEHVPSPEASITTAARVLKPGGILYLHTPAVSILDRWMHVALQVPGAANIARIWQRGRTSVFHLQNYTLPALRELVTARGFTLLSAEQRTELSWPVERYARVYLTEKGVVPASVAQALTPVLHALFVSRLNRNKAIIVARRD